MNLHVVVSMDPANEFFRPRLESNPALITRASVQWLDAWSQKGMMDIGKAKLTEMLESSLDTGSGLALSDEIIAHLVHMHCMMGPAVQPREYIAFVDLYCKNFNSKRKQVTDQKKFLRGGLSKLAEAEETVDTLSKAADKQRALLKIKQAEAEEALGFIQESMMKVREDGRAGDLLAV